MSGFASDRVRDTRNGSHMYSCVCGHTYMLLTCDPHLPPAHSICAYRLLFTPLSRTRSDAALRASFRQRTSR